jgi:hypothetical protein
MQLTIHRQSQAKQGKYCKCEKECSDPLPQDQMTQSGKEQRSGYDYAHFQFLDTHERPIHRTEFRPCLQTRIISSQDTGNLQTIQESSELLLRAVFDLNDLSPG